MGLHQRHGSSGNVKRTMSLERKQQHVVPQKDQDKLPKPGQIASPNFSTRSRFKKKSYTGQTVKRPAVEVRQSLVDDDFEFDKQFDNGRCSSDDDDCTWLSGGASPSTFFREYRLSGAYNVDSRLVSWLSKLADSYLSLTSKAQEQGKTKDENILRKGLKEDLDSILLLNPDVEGIRAWSKCSCEDATNCSCSLSPLSSYHESSQISDSGRTNSVITSQLSDIRRTNSIVSLIDEEPHSDNLPGPSCQSIWCSEVKLIDMRHEFVEPASHTEQRSEALEKRDSNCEEPIFWPFNQDWSSEESWTYFSMSPPKDRPKLRYCEGTFPPLIGSKHCGRRPSRLEESMKASVKVVPLDPDGHIIKQEHGNAAMPESVFSSRNILEDDFSSTLELPIETVVGLDEFDGHEGIHSEVHEDIFLLDEFISNHKLEPVKTKDMLHRAFILQ